MQRSDEAVETPRNGANLRNSPLDGTLTRESGGEEMPQDLERRVEILEHKAEILVEVPERVSAVESQILQLRTEMRYGFSAIRAEIRTGDEDTRRVLRAEIRAGDQETRRILQAEIREGDRETQRQMRVLHEEIIGRIKLLGEGGAGRDGCGASARRPADALIDIDTLLAHRFELTFSMSGFGDYAYELALRRSGRARGGSIDCPARAVGISLRDRIPLPGSGG
jgi:hypothetical protein